MENLASRIGADELAREMGLGSVEETIKEIITKSIRKAAFDLETSVRIGQSREELAKFAHELLDAELEVLKAKSTGEITDMIVFELIKSL